MKLTSRRSFLMLAGATGAALLAACGGAASPTAAPAKPTEAPKPAAAEPTKPAAAAPAATTAPAAAATSAPAPAATSAPAVGAASPAAGATTAAGAAGATPAAKPAAAGNFAGTILFGAPISLTGSTAKEGGLTKEGYDIWRDVYNESGGVKVAGKAYRIETKYYDDESNAQKTATLAEKLIKEDKVNLLLGPYGTSGTLQMSTVAEKNKMPMVEGNGAAESIFSQGYKYTFGVLSPAQNYLRGVIDMALSQTPKPETIAVLSADDPFSVEVAEAARKYAESKGLKLVYNQKYPDKSTDLRAPLTEAKSKNPDLFLNSGHLQEAVAIVQQAKELGFNAKGFGFSVGPSIPDFQTTLKESSNFIFGGTQWTEVMKFNGDDLFKTPDNYYQQYKTKFGHDPSYQSAESTACGVAFCKAIEAAGSFDPDPVRNALAKLDFISFYGQIKFDERGINIYKAMAVEQWQNGKKVTVWPAEAANAKPMWPTPEWTKR
jgi:branched-chain amino acid transport system substrate-binding protein